MLLIRTTAAVTVAFALSQTAQANPDYPLFGDINGDCIVDKYDIKQIYLQASGAKVRLPYDTDLNNDGITDAFDHYLAIGASNSTCGRRLIGDVNGDGIVNTGDTLDVLGGYGTGGYNALDINGDLSVDDIDLDMVHAQLGHTMGRRVLGDVNGDYIVNNSDVLETLTLIGNATNAADLNRDGVVNSLDLNALQTQSGETACSQLAGDTNGDKKVDVYDLITVYVAIGSSLTQFDCNQDGVVSELDYDIVNDNQGSTAGLMFSGDINGDWMIDDADIDLIGATFGTSWTQADLNGSESVNMSDLLDANSAYGLATGGELNGDIDNDCVVDAQDIYLAAAFMGGSFEPADIDGNGTVVTSDLLAIVGNNGMTCD